MLTTDQSLERLFNSPGWYKNSGINESTARVYKKRFRDGQLNLEAKMRILEQCGFKVVQEMQWEEDNNNEQLKNSLTAKLSWVNAFWSYNQDQKSVISDEKLIELVLMHLDIDDIKILFEVFSRKQIQAVWINKMVSQEPFFHDLNRLYAFLFFRIKHPDRYIRDIRNIRYQSIR